MNGVCQTQIDEAEGLAELGLWQEAWDALCNLPPQMKRLRSVARPALACCFQLGLWGAGEIFVERLRGGTSRDQRAAAIFLLERARSFPSQSATWLAAAIEIFPGCAGGILKDPALVNLLASQHVG